VTSDPDFKITAFFDIEYKKNTKVKVKVKVTIAQEESIPNIWNDTIFGDLTDLQTRRAGLSASAELVTRTM